MKTLVVHTGGIGDFLLACPAIAALAVASPVYLAGNRDRLQLGVAGGLAKAAYSLDDLDFSSVFSTPSKRFRRAMAGYERAVVWMRDTGEIAAAFRDAGIGEVRCFPGLPQAGWAHHASEYYCACLGLPPAAPFHLQVSPLESAFDVLIHPGSGSAKKNWPIARFSAVAQALRDRGRQVHWCLGPAEEEKAPFPNESIVRFDSLVDLAGALAQTKLYLGNDSGVSHLAAAVGCPSVVVFGPTDPVVWGPRGAQVNIVAEQPWPPEERVLQAITALSETTQ